MGGGDKPLRPLAGRPLLAHAIAALTPQVAALALSANGDPARFTAFALPILPDPVPDYPGPLAGILAGLEWAAGQGAQTLLTAPADCPFLPPDLAARLHRACRETGAPIAYATSAGRPHPVAALWPTSLAPALRRALAAGAARVRAFAAQHGAAAVEWPATPADPFFNVNTPADLEAAARLLPALHRQPRDPDPALPTPRI